MTDKDREERIVAAAVQQGQLTHSLPRPKRHHHVLRQMADGLSGSQGFLTSEGQFVDRWRAYEIAETAGQIRSHTDINLLTHYAAKERGIEL